MGKISKSEWGRLAVSNQTSIQLMFCAQAFAFLGCDFSRPSAVGDQKINKKYRTSIWDY